MTIAPLILAVTMMSFDGTMLSGVLTIPNEPVGAAVILQGGGNVDASGDVSSPFLGKGYQGEAPRLSVQIAETLASVGVASFRFSKRGVEDPAQLPNQTMTFLEKDAASAVEFVRERFPDKKIGIVGHSEGALLGMLVARSQPIDVLFLLAPPTQDFDLVLDYQFKQWPMQLLSGLAESGTISRSRLDQLDGGQVPGMEAFGTKWTAFDLNQNGELSMEEAGLAYGAAFQQIMGIVNSSMKPWYDSLKALPDFRGMAAQVTSPVYYYQGGKDAQVPAALAAEASSNFPALRELRMFPELGHGFAPMQGTYGEVKTSGPFQPEMLDQLQSDAASAFAL